MYSFNEAKSSKKEESIIPVEAIKSFQPNCVRQKTNWSTPEKHFRFENTKFDKDIMKANIESHSPKLYHLLEHIRQLDAHDIQSGKFLQKHFIFTDLQSSDYGAKMLASGLLAYGYKLGFGKTSNNDLKYKSLSELEKTAYNNFFLLTSVQLFDKPMKTKDKRKMLQLFNARPSKSLNLWKDDKGHEADEINNVYGKYIRFIILDSEFKEGIDLLDVKYVHMFEPATQPSDQTQIIGRATRAYGQCGLTFTPNIGWPLHVYIYDIAIPPSYQSTFLNSKNLFELYQNLYLRKNNIDIQLSVFANLIQNLTIQGSVDYELNRILLKFQPDELQEIRGGGKDTDYDNLPVKIIKMNDQPKSLKKENSDIKHSALSPNISKSRVTYNNIRELIRQQFQQYTWKESDLQNNCQDLAALKPRLTQYPTIDGQENGKEDDEEDEPKKTSKKGGNNELIQLNPTQKFIPAYFVPENPVKGMLLWHGTGTGKTCIAVATATNKFESEEYTILWVTRTSLKSDFYKNIFDQSCHQGFREKLAKKELEIPTSMESRLKLLSKSWKIPPLSYKQFTNLVAKKNQFYNQLVKINGAEDPLRKTLLIIDEAHKLFSQNDLVHQEMPDVKELKAAIHHSYRVSGKESVRLLLMSATPIGESTMEMVQLINLCKDSTEQIPETFDDFSIQYLDEKTGEFTSRGRRQYLDDIAGKVSYLNRESDMRLFAQPTIERVQVTLNVQDLQTMKLQTKTELEKNQKESSRKIKRVAQQLKSVVDHIKKYDQAYFLKKLKGKHADSKIVENHVQSILQKVRPFFSKYRMLYEQIDYEKTRLLEKHQKEMMNWEEESKLRKDNKSSFNKSILSVLLNKCGIEEVDTAKQHAQLELHPKIMKLNESIHLLREGKKDLEEKLDEANDNYDKAIKLFKGLPEKERENLFQQPGFKKDLDALYRERKNLTGLLQKINQQKKEKHLEKKVIFNDLKQKLPKGLKKTRKYKNAEEIKEKEKSRRLKKGGKTRTLKQHVDSILLYRRKNTRKRGGSVEDDVNILTEKLTNERVDKILEEIDEFIKNLLVHHIVEMKKE